MKKNWMGLALLTTLSMASFAASADDEAYKGSWYALPGISYNWTDSDLKADDGVGGFIRMGKEFAPNWDLQFGGSYARVDGNTTGKYKQTLLGVDALYMFSREKLRPFLLVGVGYAHNKLDLAGSGSKDSVMGNIGAGVQYLVTENLGLQADLRSVWSEANVGGDNKTVGNTILNLGAIFRFGAPAPMPAPMPVVEAPVVEAPVVEAPVVEAPVIAAKPACKPVLETITIQSEALFDFDKYTIKGKNNQVLDEVAAKIKEHDDVEFILVTGHTDKIGTDAYNQKLSERRADAVRKYLVSHGVNDVHIKSVGKGESEPVVDCKGVKGNKKIIECLAPNRRVVVDATHKQEDGCAAN